MLVHGAEDGANVGCAGANEPNDDRGGGGEGGLDAAPQGAPGNAAAWSWLAADTLAMGVSCKQHLAPTIVNKA